MPGNSLMGYVKKSEMRKTDDGRTSTMIGVYKVIKNSDHMTGIYKDNELVTSKPKWSQAVKLAGLLADAYQKGREFEMEEWEYRR